MSNLNLNEVVSLHKANVDNVLSCTAQVFQGLEKLVNLNMQVAKASLQETMEAAKKASAAKDAPALVAAQSKFFQPLEVAQKAFAYSRQIFDLTNEVNAGLRAALEKAGEKSVSNSTQVVQTALDTISKDSQALANSAVSMVSTAVSSAADSVGQFTKQAAELANSGMQQAVKSSK